MTIYKERLFWGFTQFLLRVGKQPKSVLFALPQASLFNMGYWSFLLLLGLQSMLVSGHVSGQMTTSGGHCVFPFRYKGVLYRSCTTKNHHRPWCSTTANYDIENEWGNCAGFVASGVDTNGGETCAFPFTYEGVVYKSCTTKNHVRPWCSTTVSYDKDNKWGNCSGFTPSEEKTNKGEYCVFPFKYEGVSYQSCTTKDSSRPWCSITAIYDNMWGPCEGFSSGRRTTSGEYCAFPFVYWGHNYNNCTSVWHHRPWCSTTTNYDKDKKWDNCV